MTVSYPTLDDYLHTAAYVLDLPVETVIKSARIELAESALHAPQAGWGEVEFYPELPMKGPYFWSGWPRTAPARWQQARRASDHDRLLRCERVRLDAPGRRRPRGRGCLSAHADDRRCGRGRLTDRSDEGDHGRTRNGERGWR